MTCIVGTVSKKGVVTIGGDASSVGITLVDKTSNPKVFRVGDFIIGASGSFRALQLLQHALKPPKYKKGRDIHEYMTISFINAVKKCYEEGDFQEDGWSFLVGFKGRLFTIYNDFQVNEPSRGYSVVGCGEHLAKGVLWANRNKKIKEKERVLEALLACEEHLSCVTGPFIIKKDNE